MISPNTSSLRFDTTGRICKYADLFSVSGIIFEPRDDCSTDEDASGLGVIVEAQIDIIPKKGLTGWLLRTGLIIEPVHAAHSESLTVGGEESDENSGSSTAHKALSSALFKHLQINCPTCPSGKRDTCQDRERLAETARDVFRK